YMRALRERKIKRAQKMIETGSYKQEHENSPRSLLKQEHQTKDGKTATKTTAKINQEKIDKDAKFDGFYCNATNLFKEECSTQQIAAIGARRWEIEECFRIMKTSLKSRPYYHNKDSRIIAHFITCFMSLVLIRGLERKIALQAGPHDRYPNGKYTVDELLQAIKEIELVSLSQGQAFMPSYNNSELISELLKLFGMEQFGQQVVMKDTLKNILKKIKEDPEMYQEDEKAK
ncbi:MAG: transposase, partial [Succinivibrio sp.]|nr:transposase [Succinivibrio sp.]